MEVDELVQKLIDLDLINNTEKCIDTTAFSKDLSIKKFSIRNSSGCIDIGWWTKYWDEDVDAQQLVINQIKEVIQYWFKKLNITDWFNVYIEVCPFDCDFAGIDDSREAYLSEDLIIENGEWRR